MGARVLSICRRRTVPCAEGCVFVDTATTSLLSIHAQAVTPPFCTTCESPLLICDVHVGQMEQCYIIMATQLAPVVVYVVHVGAALIYVWMVSLGFMHTTNADAIHTYVRTYVRAYACTHTHTHTHAHDTHMHAHTNVRTSINPYTVVHMCMCRCSMCMYVCMCNFIARSTCTHTHPHTCMHTDAHTHTHLYMHTCIPPHIHTYVPHCPK